MNRPTPAETKLVICVWHPFTEWRPKPAMADAIRTRWPEMRVLHLPNYDRLRAELPDTDIFVGYSLRAEQLKGAKKLKWIHSTAAGVAQLMYPELRDSRIMVTNPSGIFSVPMAAGAGAEFSGLGTRARPGAMGAAGNLGQAAALDGAEWESAAHRGLRLDRAGSGEAGEGV
jgi:hypothetical protein